MSLFDSASLVVTPNGVKEGKLYSIKPTDGSGDLSVTRATTATRVNSAGLVEVVPVNLLTYSEQFDNSDWGKVNATITANATTAPDGTLTADKFESVSSSPESQLFQTINSPSNTISLYAKAGNINILNIWIGSLVSFNLSTGVVTAGTATMENAGNGWWRCIIPTTYNVFNPFFNATASGQFVYVWGAQAVQGTSAKDYYPTTTRLNIPRLDYTNGSCPSILVEPQRTNLVDVSNGASGNFFNGVVVLNAATSPQGINNAFSFNVNDGQSGGQAFVTLTTSSQSYTFSAYLKGSVNGQKVRLFGDLNGTIQDFTLTTEWVRYTKTFTGSVGAQSFYLLNGSYFSPAQNDLYFGYGMQIEVGSYATSLIPTQGSTVTRNADVISKTGISSLIGTEFTLFLDAYETTGGNGTRYLILKGSGGTYANAIFLEANASNQIALTILNSSSSSVFGSIATGLTNGQRFKLAVRCKNNDFAFYLNGSLVASQASGSVPTTSDLYLGYYIDYSDNYSQVNAAAIWPTALSNDELAQLTTI